MKILLIGAALGLFAGLVSAQQSAPASPSSIDGLVTKLGSDQPLPKATVQLRTGGRTVLSTSTDGEGKFNFPAVPPGQYGLIASRDGYVPAEYGQRQPGGPSLVLKLAAGQRQSDVHLRLTAGGVISGRVTDRGKPVTNTLVVAVRSSYELGRHIASEVLSGVTDDRGEYHIFWLPPGRYYVAADVNDNAPDQVVAHIRSSATDEPPLDSNLSRVGISEAFYASRYRFVFSRSNASLQIEDPEMHVRTYYPNTTDFLLARPIDVGPGTEFHGVDITADPVRSAHVRGVVSGVADTGSRGQTVQVLPFAAVPNGSNTNTSVLTDPNGAFDIARVPPGSYVLRTNSQSGARGANGQVQQDYTEGRVQIAVRDRDVNGVAIEPRRPVTVNGRLIVERQTAMSPEPGMTLRVALTPDQSGSGGTWQATTLAADGTFTVRVLPVSDYGFRVLVPPLLNLQVADLTTPALPKGLENAYVKSIRFGQADVLNDGFRLTEQSRDALTITIGTNPAMVEGRVMDAQQQPSAATTVVLIPNGGLRFQVNHKYTSTDEAGHFQITNVAPGDYTLFAWETVESGAWQNPDFVRDYESAGKLVRIDEGVKTTDIELRSIP